MTRCLVVDDHAAMREGIKAVLEGQVEVVGECGSGSDAILMARHHRPDVVLMDVRMPGMDGFEATRSILAENPGLHVVLYTASEDATLLFAGLDCGAHGYVLKGAPVDDILRAINLVMQGGVYVDPSLVGAMASPRRVVGKLSPREREVLILLSQGRSDLDIADKLYLSPETVRTHARNARRKLNAANRTHAVALAFGLGLIAPSDAL